MFKGVSSDSYYIEFNPLYHSYNYSKQSECFKGLYPSSNNSVVL